MNIELYFDGACEPNPNGTGTFGFVIRAGDVLDIRKGGLVGSGDGMTNNVAEYTALGMALKALSVAAGSVLTKADTLTIRGDSQLVINQLNDVWTCRNERLAKLLARCHELLTGLGVPWKAEWVSRDQNEEADRLTQEAYTTATGKPFPERKPKAAAPVSDGVHAKCASCGAAILWVKTQAGKLMPVDAAPCADGNVFITKKGDGLMVVCEKGTANASSHKSHFATCPNAAGHRKVKDEPKKPAPTAEKMGRQPPGKCHWCEQPGKFLCDGRKGEKGRTCDAPMCEAHRTNMGSMHIDYRDEHGKRRGRWESTDYCPECAAAADGDTSPEDD